MKYLVEIACFHMITYFHLLYLQLRLQSCLDTNPELAEKLISTETEKKSDKETNRVCTVCKNYYE